MKALLNGNVARARTLAAMSLLWLALAQAALGGEPAKPEALPPGSFVLRGSPVRDKSAVAPPGTSLSTPEHLFGLRVEQAMKTNGNWLITSTFDIDTFFLRFVQTLPVSEGTRQSLSAAPRNNEALRRDILKDVVAGIAGSHIRFLGARRLGQEPALLFRDTDTPPIVSHRDTENVGSAAYFAFITERQPDSSIRLIDVQRFAGGEMLSQTMRRRILLELARKKLLDDRLSANDQALMLGLEGLRLFDSRCSYGHFDLIKQAYEKLPTELQNDRSILYRYATSGEQNIKDILVPVERWRLLYPGDPTPDLLVVDFYWRLYHGPRHVQDGPDKGVYAYAAWSAQQEEAVTAAIQKANAWLGDPALEIHLASYYGPKRPDKARPLLQQALQRFPLETQAFAELLKIDLASTNFVGVADTLRRQEVAFQTNLTSMVAARQEYAVFRKSFPWKLWQRNYHDANIKSLMDVVAQPGK